MTDNLAGELTILNSSRLLLAKLAYACITAVERAGCVVAFAAAVTSNMFFETGSDFLHCSVQTVVVDSLLTALLSSMTVRCYRYAAETPRHVPAHRQQFSLRPSSP